jgi:hypothetical protein
MSKNDQYLTAAKNILRGVMVTKGVNFIRLAELLSADGEEETPKSVAAKINRGRFPFSFFLRCMSVLGMAGGFFLVPTREEMLAMESSGLVTNPHDRADKPTPPKRPATTRRSQKSASSPRKKEANLATD